MKSICLTLHSVRSATSKFGVKVSPHLSSLRLLPLLILSLSWSCTSTEPMGAEPPEPSCASELRSENGSYAVGVRTLDLDGLLVEVWYPAEPPEADVEVTDVYDMRDWLPAETREQIPADAPTTFATASARDARVRGGERYPVVLFSHGFGGFRTQSSFLMQHLASWGFMVVAPEHAERNITTVLSMGTLGDNSTAQIRDAFEALRDGTAPSADDLSAAGDFDHVFLMGHSAGGAPVQNLVDDPEFPVEAWAGLATIAFPTSEGTPGLVLTGDSDAIAELSVVAGAYEDLATRPKHFVNIARAGHLAFSDICAIGREEGGVLSIAVEAGLDIPPLVQTLATDGCRMENLSAEEGWPIINHYVTAHFLSALTGEERGLDPTTDACFGEQLIEARHER